MSKLVKLTCDCSFSCSHIRFGEKIKEILTDGTLEEWVYGENNIWHKLSQEFEIKEGVNFKYYLTTSSKPYTTTEHYRHIMHMCSKKGECECKIDYDFADVKISQYDSMNRRKTKINDCRRLKAYIVHRQ